MSFNSMYICGANTLVYQFADATIHARWDERMREIKAQSTMLQAEFESGSVPEAVHRERASQWLLFVAGFSHEFGSAFVPPDIKEAVNGTELFLGRAQTIW